MLAMHKFVYGVIIYQIKHLYVTIAIISK